MIIPDRVNICGLTVEVKVYDREFIQDGACYSGLFRAAFMDISLFKKSTFTDRLSNSSKQLTHTVEEIMQTFYHELWHAICNSSIRPKDGVNVVNTESNCELFGNIAMNLNGDNNLVEIFNVFRSIVTEIDESVYRKLEYVVKNTRFEFDELPENIQECDMSNVPLGNVESDTENPDECEE